jgi:hypothetical protein
MHDDASPSSEAINKPEKQQTRLERDPIGSLDDQDQPPMLKHGAK